MLDFQAVQFPLVRYYYLTVSRPSYLIIFATGNVLITAIAVQFWRQDFYLLCLCISTQGVMICDPSHTITYTFSTYLSKLSKDKVLLLYEYGKVGTKYSSNVNIDDTTFISYHIIIEQLVKTILRGGGGK